MASEYVSRKRPAAVNLAKYRETLSWRDLYSKTQFAAMNDASNVALGSMLLKKSAASRPGLSRPCLPTKTERPPEGGLWLHEIKHHGFRVIARKNALHCLLPVPSQEPWCFLPNERLESPTLLEWMKF
jgi:ATP-dependent DNA ligase